MSSQADETRPKGGVQRAETAKQKAPKKKGQIRATTTAEKKIERAGKYRWRRGSNNRH